MAARQLGQPKPMGWSKKGLKAIGHKDLLPKWWKDNSQSFYKSKTTIQDKTRDN
jgi:hypothetical protein